MKLLKLLSSWLFLLVNGTLASTVFISNYGMTKMLEMSTRPPYCVVQMDRGKIRDMLLNTDPRRMKQMSDESIEQLEKVCKNNHIHSPHQGGFIYPGTKWCGPGDRAKNHSDLGFHMKEDLCCRTHDECPKFLSSGECAQGICNKSRFTRSHCDCDAAFRKCLQNVNTETANTIGAIFFNVIQVICFKERTPCTPWQRLNDYPDKPLGHCFSQFQESPRFMGSVIKEYNPRNKKSRFVNTLLRKIGYL